MLSRLARLAWINSHGPMAPDSSARGRRGNLQILMRQVWTSGSLRNRESAKRTSSSRPTNSRTLSFPSWIQWVPTSSCAPTWSTTQVHQQGQGASLVVGHLLAFLDSWPCQSETGQQQRKSCKQKGTSLEPFFIWAPFTCDSFNTGTKVLWQLLHFQKTPSGNGTTLLAKAWPQDLPRLSHSRQHVRRRIRGKIR